MPRKDKFVSYIILESYKCRFFCAESTRTDLIYNYQKLYDRRNPNGGPQRVRRANSAAKVHIFGEKTNAAVTINLMFRHHTPTAYTMKKSRRTIEYKSCGSLLIFNVPSHDVKRQKPHHYSGVTSTADTSCCGFSATHAECCFPFRYAMPRGRQDKNCHRGAWLYA